MAPSESRNLARWRLAIGAVAAAPEPTARWMAPGGVDLCAVRRLAALPGAFDPPTRAHLALAEAAAGSGFDRVACCLGVVTLDKPRGWLCLEERGLLLERLAAARPWLGVVLHNRGRYLEIAEALGGILPSLEDLAFVIGDDKLPQLFDPRYYDDLEGSLERLFARARFLVAPRLADPDAAWRPLAEGSYRRFAHRFESLPLPTLFRAVSATRVRQDLAAGRRADRWLPPEVTTFVERTGAGRDPRAACRRRDRSG